MKELEKGLEKSFKPLKELKICGHAEVDPRKQGLKRASIMVPSTNFIVRTTSVTLIDVSCLSISLIE